MDKKRFAGRILQLTLEIIYLLTGEDYIIMKKSSDHMTSKTHSGQRKNQTPSPNEQKILEVANSIIHLLTGEVLSCSEDWEEPCEIPLDEPITSHALSRSSSRLVAFHLPMTLPNQYEESEYVEGSHRASNLTKGHKGSALVEQRAPNVGGLQGTDQFQVYPLCAPTPTPCAQEAAVSEDDYDDFEYTMVQFKEELVSREEEDLEQGQLANVESSTRNQYQAHEDGLKGGKCHNVKRQFLPAEDFARCHTLEPLRASSPSTLKAKPYKCPECPSIFTCYSDLLQHQSHHQRSLVSPMPCDRQDADCQDLQYTLVPAEDALGKGSLKRRRFSKANTSTPKHVPQPRSCSNESSEVSNAAEHHTDVEYMLVEIKEKSMLVEQIKGDLAKVKTLQSWTNEDRSKGKDLSSPGTPLHFLHNTEGSSSQLGVSPTPKTLNYQCTECPKCFNRLSQLVEHQKTHQKSMFLTSPPSGDREPTAVAHGDKDLDYFLVEIKEEFEGAEKGLAEDVDDSKASSDDDQLEAFEADAFSTQGKPIGCKNKTTKGAAGVPGEVATFPSPIPNAMIYKCPECPDVFNCRSDLLKHQTHHRGSTLFSCSVCGKNFTSKSNLAKHHKIHTGEKPYSCAECGKSFREKHYLASHQAVHSGTQLITCAVCGKGYTSKSNLAKHQRIHTGQKPFACSICGKSFNQRSVLLVHQRTHTGEKPFSCQLCQRRFTDKLQLERHQITHTGEKPFSCSHCGKSFTRKNILVKHLANH